MSEIRIPPHDLPGNLILPAQPQAVAAFAHGSGRARRPTHCARTISSGVSQRAAMRVATEPSTAALRPP